jgi:hypothetical protein
MLAIVSTCAKGEPDVTTDRSDSFYYSIVIVVLAIQLLLVLVLA